MVTVGQLLKFLSEQGVQQSPVRLTIFNYFSSFHDQHELLNADIIENFFYHALDYVHWQQNRGQLQQETQWALQNVVAKHNAELDLSQIRWPKDIQVIEIDNFQDLSDAIQVYIRSQNKGAEKIRVMNDQSKRVIALVLDTQNKITARVFDKKMTLRHGHLEPLKKDFALYYDENLNLDETKLHSLEVAPFVTAQFTHQQNLLSGKLIRGYVAQKFADLKAQPIESYPKLFYSIKRIEQFFLSRETDIFYQSLVSSLERTTRLAKLHDPQALAESTDVLAKTQNALEFVFVGDRMLSLLLRELQHTIAARPIEARKIPALEAVELCLNPSDLTNSSPTAGSRRDVEPTI